MKGEQLALPATGRARGVRRGRVERSIDAAAAAARRADPVPATALPLVTLARALARAIDTAEQLRKVYALPQLARELRDTLAALGWAGGNGGAADPFTAWLAELGDPADAHPTDTRGP